MPQFNFSTKDTMLNALMIGALSLHSAYASDGSLELVGGDPAYQRLVPTFAPSVSGTIYATSGPYIFDVPGGSQVGFLGLWATDGVTFLGMMPNGGFLPMPFVVTDPNDGRLWCPAHGFATGDYAVSWNNLFLGEGQSVWVVTVVDANSITLLAPDGVTPPSFTVPFAGFIQKVIFQTFATQGQFSISAISINANTGA